MEAVKDGEKTRTLIDINQDYTQACFIYGDREYKMRHMKQEQEASLVKMKDLDAEAQVISQAKIKAAKETEVAPKEADLALAPEVAPEPVTA